MILRGKTVGLRGKAHGVALMPDKMTNQEMIELMDVLKHPQTQQKDYVDRQNVEQGTSFPVYDNPYMNRGGSMSEQICPYCGSNDTFEGPSYPPLLNCNNCGERFDPDNIEFPEEWTSKTALYPEQFLGGGYILIKAWMTPNDDELMLNSKCRGFVTAGGGSASHAIIIAQQTSKPIVVDVRELDQINPSDWIEIDGSTGVVSVNSGDEEVEDVGPGEQAADATVRWVWSKGNNAHIVVAEDPQGQMLHPVLIHQLMSQGKWDMEDNAYGFVYNDNHADIMGNPSDIINLEAWLKMNWNVDHIEKLQGMGY